MFLLYFCNCAIGVLRRAVSFVTNNLKRSRCQVARKITSRDSADVSILGHIMVCKSKYKKVCVLPLDFTFRIGSTPTFLYFYFYLNTAYAGHYVYFIMVCTMTVGLCSIKNCSGLLSFLGGQTRYSLSTNLSNLCECNPLYNEVVVSAFFDMDVQSTA